MHGTNQSFLRDTKIDSGSMEEIIEKIKVVFCVGWGGAMLFVKCTIYYLKFTIQAI